MTFMTLDEITANLADEAAETVEDIDPALAELRDRIENSPTPDGLERLQRWLEAHARHER